MKDNKISRRDAFKTSALLGLASLLPGAMPKCDGVLAVSHDGKDTEAGSIESLKNGSFNLVIQKDENTLGLAFMLKDSDGNLQRQAVVFKEGCSVQAAGHAIKLLGDFLLKPDGRMRLGNEVLRGHELNRGAF